MLPADLENSIAHAVHEYVKRDNLFCLSTSSGNTYYMQVTITYCSYTSACALLSRKRREELEREVVLQKSAVIFSTIFIPATSSELMTFLRTTISHFKKISLRKLYSSQRGQCM